MAHYLGDPIPNICEMSFADMAKKRRAHAWAHRSPGLFCGVLRRFFPGPRFFVERATIWHGVRYMD
jgi:hypothetical protein